MLGMVVDGVTGREVGQVKVWAVCASMYVCECACVCAGVLQELSRPDEGLGCMLNHSGSYWAHREGQEEISWGLGNPGWVFLAPAFALQLFLWPSPATELQQVNPCSQHSD